MSSAGMQFSAGELPLHLGELGQLGGPGLGSFVTAAIVRGFV